MVELHHATTGDLFSRVVKTGSDPVTLVIPSLPEIQVLDQLIVQTGQRSRKFRLVTSLYGPGPSSTIRQVDSLIRLTKVGVKIRVTEHEVLPSLLTAPPSGSVLLPLDWGRGSGKWQCPMIIKGADSRDIFSLTDKIWRRAGSYFSLRRLRLIRRWLDEIEPVSDDDRESDADTGGIELAALTLFDKRRGPKKRKVRRGQASWWTFHGTSDDRVNPFMPVSIWALQRNAYKLIRFPDGRRPTGVRSGDNIFFVIHSREPGRENLSYIIGQARALKYRELIDDATDDQRSGDPWLDRFPHALRLENAIFIRGAVGEGIPVNEVMSKLGAEVFKSTSRNKLKGSGNTDPSRSIAQKTMIQLTENSSIYATELLEKRMNHLGLITAGEIARL